MTYVPTPVVPPTANVSPRARDLARTLEGAVQEYRQRNPSLTDEEVRQALTVMSSQRMAGSKAMVLSLALGLALAVLAAAFLLV